MIEPNFEYLKEKKLIGLRLNMSLTENKTGALWRSFMPRRNEIKNTIGTDLYSIQVYKKGYFDKFNTNTEFEKWAAIEVADSKNIPPNMEPFTLKEGLYAVFHYKGKSSDTKIFEYIFTNWLPKSNYKLDNRPHFEILGNLYKNNDADSEEDIWIPVKIKPLII